MCCDHLLSKTTHGKVYQSECDNNYVIMYKNVVLIQDPENFEQIYMGIRRCWDSIRIENSIEKDDEDGHYVFKTISSNILLTFTALEVAELSYLLETAYLETIDHATL